jgi:hypothetical protein
VNRNQLRTVNAQIRARFPWDDMRPMPKEQWPTTLDGERPRKVWVSRGFLAQLYQNETGYRISVCRTQLGPDGRWVDGITWDDLQRIKREIGFGDVAAIEVYPADDDLVDVANVRHLWIPNEPLPIGWFKDMKPA